jgi:cytochrome P450
MTVAVGIPARGSSSLPPGPRLPPVLQGLQRSWRYAEFSDRGHARYGDTFTVRWGSLPTGVLTKDREAIRRLFTGDPLVRRHSNDPMRVYVGEHALFVLEPAEHLVRRKMLLPPFHGERVQSYARLMERLVSTELDRFKPGEVVAIQPIAGGLALDVILQGVLGVSDVATRQRLRQIFDSMITPLSTIGSLIVPQLSRRSRWNVLAERFWRLKDELDALVLEHIAATRADKLLAEREDILAMMVLARDEDGVGLTDAQLHDELLTLITAGHDTTATAISWGIELLVHNQAVMAKAREGDDAYLEATVKEILRIRSPVPTSSSRFMLEPFPIGKWTIPTGVAIYVDGYGIHHDPAIYPQPDVFRPERFLEEPPDTYSFLPFGGGAHRCLGAGLAMLEVKIVLREILARFELVPASSRQARPVPHGVTLAPSGGVRVRVRVLSARPGAAAGMHATAATAS